jgi:hypothetical protein
MNDLVMTLESAPEWVWMIILVALVISLMVRNQRQAYAYGVWDATHTPESPAVIHVLDSTERRAWKDGEVAHLFATDVQLIGIAGKRH